MRNIWVTKRSIILGLIMVYTVMTGLTACIDHFAIVESCVFFSKLYFFCKLFETFKYVVIYLFCSIEINNFQVFV